VDFVEHKKIPDQVRYDCIVIRGSYPGIKYCHPERVSGSYTIGRRYRIKPGMTYVA
jgi:hypothetical protein